MWKKEEEREETKQLIFNILKQVGIAIREEQFKFRNCGNPHKPKLPKDNMAIYTFQYNNTFLKIGKCSAKNKSRFYSHHYHPSRNHSNLSKSILRDSDMNYLKSSQSEFLTDDTVGDWIKMNTTRIDILLDANLSIFTINLIESILHSLYHPRYEGHLKLRNVSLDNREVDKIEN